MSRFGGPALRFASKTTYEALEVHSGEESDGSSELDQEVTAERFVQDTHVFIPQPKYCYSLPEEPVKLTKSAMKKASRIARLERKQALKEKARKEKLAGNTSSNGESVNANTPDVVTLLSEEIVDVELRSDTPPAIRDASDQDPAPSTPNLVSHEPASEVLDKPANGFHHIPNSDMDTDEKEQAADTSAPEPHNGVLANGSLEEATPTPTPVTEDPEKVKKRQNALTRTLWTFIMIGGFISLSSISRYVSQADNMTLGLLLLGHVYMVLLVFLCQTLVYREVTALFSLKTVTPDNPTVAPLKGKDPWSKTLNWYFFAATNYFLYGESIIHYFKVRIMAIL